MNSKKLYLAAPLFSEAERNYNVYLRNILSRFYEVYLPQEDGLLMVDLVQNGMDEETAADVVFKNDMDAIESCDIILIVLDGRTVDEGAAFELGVAFSKNKKCIALQTDSRRLLPIGNNPMISCSAAEVFSSIVELVDWAKADCIAGKGDRGNAYCVDFLRIREEKWAAGGASG